MVSGQSERGRRVLRRAIVARSLEVRRHQFVILTLTSQARRSDADMRYHLGKLLDWGRKYCPAWFGWYVWVAEDQARGVLHFHVLVSQRLPRGLYRRVRSLWCDTYGMGAGAFDTTSLRYGAKAAASYLGKYLTKRPSGWSARIDPDGTLQVEPWPVSRHTGEPYVRRAFRGNPYGMSESARFGTRPVVEFTAPEGAFPGLDGWHGVHRFHESPEDAMRYLGSVLDPPPSVGGDTATGPSV